MTSRTVRTENVPDVVMVITILGVFISFILVLNLLSPHINLLVQPNLPKVAEVLEEDGIVEQFQKLGVEQIRREGFYTIKIKTITKEYNMQLEYRYKDISNPNFELRLEPTGHLHYVGPRPDNEETRTKYMSWLENEIKNALSYTREKQELEFKARASWN